MRDKICLAARVIREALRARALQNWEFETVPSPAVLDGVQAEAERQGIMPIVYACDQLRQAIAVQSTDEQRSDDLAQMVEFELAKLEAKK